jgi:hypothetical protein
LGSRRGAMLKLCAMLSAVEGGKGGRKEAQHVCESRSGVCSALCLSDSPGKKIGLGSRRAWRSASEVDVTSPGEGSRANHSSSSPHT